MPKLLILFFLLISYLTQAQYRIYSNEFLNIGVGARGLAMAHSNIASSKGINAGYWNPASLSDQEKTYEFSLMHSEYFAGIAKYDFLGVAKKIDDSLSMGISLIRFGIDDIPNTLELVDENGNVDYNRITMFSVADYAVLITLSKKTKIKGLSLGTNLKIIFRNQGEFANAYGFGFDAGLNYKINNWKFGFNLRDASTTFNAWFYNTEKLTEVFIRTNNDIPENGLELTAPKILSGVARNFSISDKFSLLTEIGSVFSFDGEKNALISSKVINIEPHFGIELDFKKMLYFRLGIGNFSKIQDFDEPIISFQPALGIGICIFNVSIDYALTDIGDQSAALYSNVFSLKYAFSRLKKEKNK